MRAIHLVRLDKTRPAVILTRSVIVSRLRTITVAPITTTVRGLFVEVAVGRGNGLDHDSAINCDNITSVDASAIGRHVGYLRPDQEEALREAILLAFDFRSAGI